ncbi:bifunctional protein tyrosine phosphatase family protein/NAD(P)/FAD-dependent oxidoreductase [Rhizobium giardinii]|uniref:Sulfide:quinone oxidoreductase n=1 Tax=Rhizobium giardinii TaxID=56731 RepID=A0A7W8X8C8_9HYPH|nr:bifunctional protein tyrosine phosphatase family protein/NAD(P)/FAD-dependent oxidoreductase [Rhizobium giardinii]MBB5537185.1 sulfide:quinone oxidoreductase [Rhizobium giardinii]
MDIRKLTDMIAASPQIEIEDIEALAALGYKSIMSNRPDGEEPSQPSAEVVRAAAEAAGLAFAHVPVVGGSISDADIEALGKALKELPQPVLGFCRTGTRTTTLWALSQSPTLGVAPVMSIASQAGYDLSALRSRLEARSPAGAMKKPALTCDVLIVGAGSAGIATAASLLKRRPGLDILIIDPSDRHAYQPGWTMVGGGIFKPQDTVRPMRDIMPDGVRWEKVAVAAFEPERDTASLADGRTVGYRMIVAAPGIKLNWGAIEGLEDSLGRNGVTSNYRVETAPYTWSLVRNLKGGRALFTQPPMPIKCAGAPQKALYLSGDHWFRMGRINDIDIEFHNAGPVLFGVKDYVPALMEYMTKYRADLNFGSRLVSVDGPSKTATFARTGSDGTVTEDRRGFDIIHVCPPQIAPDFIRESPLAAASGWIEVDEATLQHKRFENIFALGDAASTSNAKTAAAARKQAPVVAENLLAVMAGKAMPCVYDGYGSCPLTVERGKIVLAEFGYGGKLLPTFPTWLIDGTKPSSLAWYLKSEALTPLYWHGMLKGREWLVSPEIKSSAA